MATRLQHKLHQIAVPKGTFLIGRGTECQLVLDDPLVSRRHAAIHVDGNGAATLRDLGSRNGVLLNGVRVEGEEPLRDGDLIRIGSQDISFAQTDAADVPVRAMRATMQAIPAAEVAAAVARAHAGEKTADGTVETATTPPGARSTPPSSPGASPSKPGPHLPPTLAMPAVRDLQPLDPDDPQESTTIATMGGTRAAAGLAIIGGVAEKALALGRAEEGERILSRSLVDVLGKASRGEVDAELAERAASFAIRLAAGTGRGSWIDYFFRLYTAQRALPPARLVDELYAAVRRVKATDKLVLRAYTACLKEISGGFGPAERFVQQRIESFERWAP